MKIVDGIKNKLQKWLSIKAADPGRWDDRLMAMIGFNDIDGKVNQPYKQSHIVYTAVKKIASSVPQAPLKFYQNEQEVSETHPVYDLFNKPNPLMSRSDLWEATMTFLYTKGEAFWYLVDSIGQMAGTSGLPAQIQVINPSNLEHVVNDETGEITGWIFDSRIPLEINDIIHFKLYNPYDAYRGLSPIDPIRFIMQADYNATKWNNKFFENGAIPESIITLDRESRATEKDMKRIYQELINKHQGVDKSHLPLILQGGMDWKTLNLSQREMDFINSMKMNRDDILSVFGVPPFVAGYTDKGDTNRATADTANYVFWTNIKIELNRIQEKLQSDFCMQFLPGIICEFDTSGISALKKDLTSDVDNASKLFAMGFSANEINERLGLGFDENRDRDGLYIPINYVPVGETDEQEETEKKYSYPTIGKNGNKMTFQDGEGFTIDSEYSIDLSNTKQDTQTKTFRSRFLKYQRRAENYFHSKIKRYMFEQRQEVLSLLPKRKSTKDYIDAYESISGIWDDQERKLLKITTPLYRNIIDHTRDMSLDNINAEGLNPFDYSIIEARANKMKDINDTTWKALRKTIYRGYQEGETIDQITDRVKAVYNTRTKQAKIIARTETGTIMNQVQFTTYKDEGVPMKQWIGGQRPSHAAVNGEVKQIDMLFSNGLMYPGADGPAKEVINCRCSVAPVIGEV